MLVTQEIKRVSELNKALSHSETMRCLERKGFLSLEKNTFCLFMFLFT